MTDLNNSWCILIIPVLFFMFRIHMNFCIYIFFKVLRRLFGYQCNRIVVIRVNKQFFTGGNHSDITEEGLYSFSLSIFQVAQVNFLCVHFQSNFTDIFSRVCLSVVFIFSLSPLGSKLLPVPRQLEEELRAREAKCCLRTLSTVMWVVEEVLKIQRTHVCRYFSVAQQTLDATVCLPQGV